MFTPPTLAPLLRRGEPAAGDLRRRPLAARPARERRARWSALPLRRLALDEARKPRPDLEVLPLAREARAVRILDRTVLTERIVNCALTILSDDNELSANGGQRIGPLRRVGPGRGR